MNRYWILFLFLLFFSTTIHAEIGVAAGARAGFNISSLRKYNAPFNFKKRVNLGSDIAGVLRLDFNKYISLQTEIEFTQKGQGWKMSEDSLKYSGKQVINYVQFPILAIGRFGNDKIKGIIQFGPYVSYWTGGYVQNSVSIDKQSRNSTTMKHTFVENDRRVDAGLVVGAGADFKVGKGWIELALRYDAGFIGLSKKSTIAPKTFNSNFGISISYLYSIKSIE